MSTEKPILIIGAGISGLTLARVLHQHAVPAIVFDDAPPSRRQGYGITLRAWAYGPLLARLGLSADDIKHATATDTLVGGVGEVLQDMMDAGTGEVLMKAPPSREGHGGEELFRVNRFRLREWLRGGVLDVRFEHKFVGFDLLPEGGVKARFENGETVEGRLLVGADGVHSTVRSILLPSVHPTFFPAVVINGQKRLTSSAYASSLAPHMRGTNVLLGVADNTTLGISINDRTAEHVDLSWTYSRPARVEEGEDALYQPEHQADDARGVPEEFFAELEGLGKLAEPFGTVYDPEEARRDRLFNWLMRSVVVPRSALFATLAQPVVLLGDAVHAMPIFAGEGGNQGLLDGLQLGDLLGEYGVGEGCRRFYEGAYERWQDGIVTSQKRLGGLHMPIAKWRQIAAMRKAQA